MFVEERCQKLNMPPYVCNGCPEVNCCTLEKFRYDARYAQNEYRETLVDSRTGFNLTQDQISDIDARFSPLLANHP